MISIVTRYVGKCAYCKKRIPQNELVDWDKYNRNIYHKECSKKFQEENEHEARNTRAYIEAQESAYYENIERRIGDYE